MLHLPCKGDQNFITAPLTTFKIGGPADIALWPKNAQELIESIKWAKNNKLSITFLGGGSNVLIADKGIRGVLIVTTDMNSIDANESIVCCGAGIQVSSLIEFCVEANLSGVEFAGGLPGSLGGAIWMNARAYGGEFSEVVDWVETVNENLEIEEFKNEKMCFAYKKSVFQNRKLWITKAKLKLKRGNSEDIRQIAQKNIDDRNSKLQNRVNSAGCVFKNNYDCGIPSGKLIQDAGLKGLTSGGAEILQEHANFFINKNQAKAFDVVELMKIAQKEVYHKFNIRIFPEVQFLGEFTNLDGLIID